MMKSVFSERLESFGDIYSKDIELVCVAHPQSSYIDSLGREILNARQDLELQWIQSLDDLRIVDEFLPASIDPEASKMLADQIKESCGMLNQTLDCKYVGVRLLTLDKPMCPRFHVDQIPCRLLITLSGGGTEWIANNDVDWKLFDDRTNLDAPLKEKKKVNQFKAGEWSLLKGGTWQSQFNGVVHRSPHIYENRLMLSLDPIFDEDQFKMYV